MRYMERIGTMVSLISFLILSRVLDLFYQAALGQMFNTIISMKSGNKKVCCIKSTQPFILTQIVFYCIFRDGCYK